MKTPLDALRRWRSKSAPWYDTFDWPAHGVATSEIDRVRATSSIYWRDFAAAVHATRARHFAVEGYRLQPNAAFTQAFSNEFQRRLYTLGLPLEASATQCLKWCHALLPLGAELLGTQPILTVGALYKDGRPVFDPSSDDLFRCASAGLNAKDLEGRIGLNFHAWWTLPTGELIDLTLLSTLARFVAGWEAGAGVLLGGFPGQQGDHRYVPLAIGNAYAEALEEHSGLPLLATSLTPEAMAPRSALRAHAQADGLRLSRLGLLLPENQGCLPRESVKNQKVRVPVDTIDSSGSR